MRGIEVVALLVDLDREGGKHGGEALGLSAVVVRVAQPAEAAGWVKLRSALVSSSYALKAATMLLADVPERRPPAQLRCDLRLPKLAISQPRATRVLEPAEWPRLPALPTGAWINKPDRQEVAH
jgi:hypothetical protein